MKCPNCGLENPDIAQRCECRYDFNSRRVECEFDDLRPGMAMNDALQTISWNCTGGPEDFARLKELLSNPLTAD